MKYLYTTDKPIYAQLVEMITHQIVSGEFTAGEKLPSVREMAEQAAVNPNTMQKALSELERNGLVFAQRTTGRFITEDTEMLSRVRQELADKQAFVFLGNMWQLGFNKPQTLELLQTIPEARIAPEADPTNAITIEPVA